MRGQCNTESDREQGKAEIVNTQGLPGVILPDGTGLLSKEWRGGYSPRRKYEQNSRCENYS